MFRYLTAGESHGKCLIAIVEGIPAGMKLSNSMIDSELARRQIGYGRSNRMEIEEDHVEILSGVRKQSTIGSPICLLIPNRAGEKWESGPPLTALRPGHADLAGALKYDHRDLRNVLERASARETAVRAAVGAIAKQFCREMQVEIISHVTQIGSAKADSAIKREIDKARRKGNTIGGTFEVIAAGIPPGLGSYVHWDRKLDGRLAQAVMSIQAIKGVEIGLGFSYADFNGSEVHDEITYRGGFRHKSNNAGGLEGGVTNGEPIILRAVMKPIPTLKNPLPSIDLITRKKTKAAVQRSDVCAVPAASVVAEAVVAIEIVKAFQEKFGGDTIKETRRNLKEYLKQL